jgi:hypothetical protein
LGLKPTLDSTGFLGCQPVFAVVGKAYIVVARSCYCKTLFTKIKKQSMVLRLYAFYGFSEVLKEVKTFAKQQHA